MTTAVRQLKPVVRTAIESACRDRKGIEEAVKVITREFELLLTTKIEEILRAGERRLIRIADVKDMILRELETHGVAALVLDSERRILAANGPGRKMIGNITAIPDGSPLGAFVASGRETAEIEVNGVLRTVNMLTAPSKEAGEPLLLLSME